MKCECQRKCRGIGMRCHLQGDSLTREHRNYADAEAATYLPDVVSPACFYINTTYA